MTETTALVISGGGAKGAFAVGALSYLWDRGLNKFDIYAGTSTGAQIVPLALAGELNELRRRYSNSRVPDFMVPNSLSEVLNGRSLLKTDRYRETLEQVVTPSVVDKVFAAEAPQLVQTAVQLTTGHLYYFHTGAEPTSPQPNWVRWRDLQELVNDQGITRKEALIRSMMASGSEPVKMPPVEVFDGEDFTDGGVRVYVPIKAALDLGATTVFAIVLGPEVDPPVRDEDIQSTLQILMRLLGLFIADTGAKDVEAAELVKKNNPNITIHYIRPDRTLPGVSTVPHPVNMSRMMLEGEERAKDLLGTTLTQTYVDSLMNP